MDFYGRYLCWMRIIWEHACIIQRTISRYLTKLFGSVGENGNRKITEVKVKVEKLQNKEGARVNLCAQIIIYNL